jgi:hypothetical protein
MKITNGLIKQDRMTKTEEHFDLNLLDYLPNGKYCRWTATPSEIFWISVWKNRVECTVVPCNVCRTAGRHITFWVIKLYRHIYRVVSVEQWNEEVAAGVDTPANQASTILLCTLIADVVHLLYFYGGPRDTR